MFWAKSLVLTNLLSLTYGQGSSSSAISVVTSLILHLQVWDINLLYDNEASIHYLEETLQKKGVSTTSYTLEGLHYLVPSNHTALYRPKNKLILWIPSRGNITETFLKLKQQLIISVKTRVIVLLPFDDALIKNQMVAMATEGDNLVFIQDEGIKSQVSEYKVESLRWTPHGQRSLVVACKWLENVFQCDHHVFQKPTWKFNGRSFKITYPHWFEKAFTLVSLELLDVLAEDAEFRYTAPHPLGVTFGSYENGSWTGVVGDLEKRIRDIGVTVLSWNEARQEVIDYTRYFSTDYVTFVGPAPRAERRFGTLIQLFQAKLWLLYIFAGISSAFVTSLTWWFYRVKIERDTSEGIIKIILCETLWISMQAGVWQGAERLPKAHGARITLTSWWMVCLIVLNVYCGNIRAFLSINMPEKPLNTIEEILKTGEGKLLAIPGASVVSLMETSTNEVYREAWRIHAKYNQGPALQFLHYFEEVKKGNYFLGTGSTLRYFSQLCATNISECPFHVSTEPIKLDFMGFGLQKGSPLEYALSERIVWLVQTGFVLRWYQKHTNLFKLQSPCAFANTKSNDNLVPLSLHDLGVTFLILLSGLVVATVTFIFEFLICRSKISSFFRQATLIHST